MAEPLTIHYGKDAVSVYRADEDCNLFAAEVQLVAHGDAFLTSYTEGDNSQVVATDSMKNFIHRTALDFTGSSLDEFLALIGRGFLDRYDHVERVTLDGREVTFERRGGVLYQQTHADRGTAWLDLGRDGPRDHRSGRERVHLVKLRGCAFRAFVRDEYTTLPDVTNRPLHMWLDLEWRYTDVHAAFGRNGVTARARQIVREVFRTFESGSIQQVIYRMGTRLLDEISTLAEVHLEANNRTWLAIRERGDELVQETEPPEHEAQGTDVGGLLDPGDLGGGLGEGRRAGDLHGPYPHPAGRERLLTDLPDPDPPGGVVGEPDQVPVLPPRPRPEPDLELLELEALPERKIDIPIGRFAERTDMAWRVAVRVRRGTFERGGVDPVVRALVRRLRVAHQVGPFVPLKRNARTWCSTAISVSSPAIFLPRN